MDKARAQTNRRSLLLDFHYEHGIIVCTLGQSTTVGVQVALTS
jgi:hypothetical protein